MRILQIIDSLAIGGAEKMAVNYANALADRIEFSGIAVTRAEGDLKKQLQENVAYFFLNRKKTVDVPAILRLRAYCQQHHVACVQPHSSSFFTALLLKLVYPKVKIIWHDHNGLSEFLSNRKSFALKLASFFFEGIVVVNYQLKNWAEKELHCKNVIYLANFTHFNHQQISETKLWGHATKRILCLANLRSQKNHFLLLAVAEKLQQTHPDWTFHLVGKDFKDVYSDEVKAVLKEKNLENTVFIYGSQSDTLSIINSCDIAILTSQSEGLPVSLLEYGLCKRPVVATHVGEVPFVIQDQENGFIVPNYDTQAFYTAVVALIENEALRTTFGSALYQTVIERHSETAIIKDYLNWINKL